MECYQCLRSIPWGEPFLSADYHIERAEPPYVQVERAESLMVACIDCAPSRDEIAPSLREAGYAVSPDVTLDNGDA